MDVGRVYGDAALDTSSALNVGSSALALEEGGSYHAAHKDLVVGAEAEGSGCQLSLDSNLVPGHSGH